MSSTLRDRARAIAAELHDAPTWTVVATIEQLLGGEDGEVAAEIERLAAMVVTLEREKAALLGKLSELHGQRRALREAMKGVLK